MDGEVRLEWGGEPKLATRYRPEWGGKPKLEAHYRITIHAVGLRTSNLHVYAA